MVVVAAVVVAVVVAFGRGFGGSGSRLALWGFRSGVVAAAAAAD